VLRLVRPFHGHADVVCLVLCELGELDAELLEVQPGDSALLVDFPAVPDVVEVDAAEADIEFVQHAVIANAELALRTPTQALVRKPGQARTDVVNLALDGVPD
jgi:hypothetical protein